jgi:hypothetical protein
MQVNPLIPKNEQPRKKPGPPKGSGTQIVVRIHDPLLAAIDEWAHQQLDQPTRAAAFRRIAAQFLGVGDEHRRRGRPKAQAV